MRASDQLPPASGTSPIFEKAWMNLADRAASTMSQAKAMLAPAPAATPFTAHTTGFSMRADQPQRRIVEGLQRRAEIGRPAALARVAVAEVLSGGEAAAGAGEQDRAHLRVVGRRAGSRRAGRDASLR